MRGSVCHHSCPTLDAGYEAMHSSSMAPPVSIQHQAFAEQVMLLPELFVGVGVRKQVLVRCESQVVELTACEMPRCKLQLRLADARIE
mmetsp:Transcript_2307/g.5106  ORF Transcript_2307/g.5106 Transcript_2307/m.5106 type:complete len:88 (-) Transcript_2307:42-305(-)